jgi:DNA-directed RNA polymerase specialized sigma24 family protein
MSLSALIAPQLPYLRRFARALTGSQSGGDSYAVATLEALMDDGEIAKGSPTDVQSARTLLFKTFLTIWMAMPVNHATDEVPASSDRIAADRNLEALTPLPRVAFLLRAQEGFSSEEIADLLDVTPAEAEDLLEKAGREIATQLSTDVLIIEDEAVIAMDLEALVVDLGHRVTRIARTRKEAVASAAGQAPGLVLADILLADGSSGLDAVNEILLGCTVPVIFITAYPERLLTGGRPEPAFLITKPFRPETVMAVISQALFFDRRASSRRMTAQA